MAAARKPATRRKPAGANGDRQRFAVNISMQAWDIAKAGAAITLKVRDRGQLVGTIQIGQGSLRWRSANGKARFRSFPWKKFAALLDEH